MRLKRSVKVILIIILLGIIGLSFYFFNAWFFTKYKDVLKKDANHPVVESEDGIENEEEIQENIDNNEGTYDNSNETEIKPNVISKKTIDAIKEYYCSMDEVLDGKECIITLYGKTLTIKSPDKFNPITHELIEEGKMGNPFCEDSSYTLEKDKCVKEIRTPAKVRYKCPTGYMLDGIYCKEK